MFAVSYVLALVSGSGPSVLMNWLTFAFLGLGTALVTAGLVRAVLNERAHDAP
jgi:hypothetical protein